MKMKGFHPHKGRAFLEPDRRIVELVRSAAVIHGMKQDEIIANALLACFEDEKEGPLKKAYDEVAKAMKAGEFQRKQYKREPRKTITVIEEGKPVEASSVLDPDFRPWEN